MPEKLHVYPSDLRAVSRLAIDATLGITDLAEVMHHTIPHPPMVRATPPYAVTKGISGLVYGSIRAVTRLVGRGLDTLIAPLMPLLSDRRASPERESVLAALNGVLGDYLAATDNPLAIRMQWRRNGEPLDLSKAALATAIPQPSRRLLLLAHGLCLNDLHWGRTGHDHGALLAEQLDATAVYLHYNTGLHISTNGRALADMIESLLHCWPVPVEEVTIIGHSMGGLVARSACHYGKVAGHTWLQRLHKLIFLGTPHHGSPLERVGNWVQLTLGASLYTTPLATLGKLRSAGITDLRYGNLLDEDWADQDRFAPTGDQRQSVPLPEGVACYSMGATTGQSADDLRGCLLGDRLVPLPSALGEHADPRLTLPLPAQRQWIGYTMHHLDLLHRPEVYAQLRQWLAA